MCGLAGVVRRGGPVAVDPSGLADALSAALAHRGPDGRGCWLSPDRDALLVHRRLAIIDPGPDGAQPMATDDGGWRIVFNGEVYNYRQLRLELESSGERFDTASDTEVLLRLLASQGPAALSRVRGMFALACWDARDRSLLLARDRFGIKPLYVALAEGRIAFASELGALRAARLVDDGPSAAGVLAFLSWGSVPPPLTWRRGVEMLPPGTWWRWGQDGRDQRGAFADTRDAYRLDRREAQPQAAFRDAVSHAVRDTVRAHLVADVPVGVFLSGGIDSSAIVSAARSIGATSLQTFTVAFDDLSSESRFARTVASAFGTTHHELRLEAPHVVDDLPRILAHLDQPTIDAVNSFLRIKSGRGDRHQDGLVRHGRGRAVRRLSVVHAPAACDGDRARGGAAPACRRAVRGDGASGAIEAALAPFCGVQSGAERSVPRAARLPAPRGSGRDRRTCPARRRSGVARCGR